MTRSRIAVAVLSGAGVGMALEYSITSLLGQVPGMIAMCVGLWLTLLWLAIDTRRERIKFEAVMREFDRVYGKPSGTVPTGGEDGTQL